MKNLNQFIFILTFCSFSGYTLGNFVPLTEVSHSPSAHRNIAQNETLSLNDYSNLPCPDEKRYQELAREVNLVIPEGSSLDEKCDGSQRALLAKSLYLMTSLKINFPESWPLNLQRDLGNSFRFLKNNTAKLALDVTQKDSVAYNKVDDREIYLGGRYFTIAPLDAISVLVHEARHSDRQSPMHTTCDAGDIPRSAGACDEEFSISETAGAYSYGSLFEAALALYGENLSVSDRESLLISALVQFGARFNVIPKALARKVDVIIALTQDHELEIIHPFLNFTVPLKLKFSSKNEFPVRIEFSSQHNGMFIYTNIGRIWSWSAESGLKSFNDRLLSKTSVAHVSRVRVPFRDITSYVVLDDKNNLKFIDYSPTLNETQLNEYPLNAGKRIDVLPEFSTFFLSLSEESTYLDKDGKIYFTPHYGNEPTFGQSESFNSSKWTQGTGGVIYDSLYLVNQEGELKFVTKEVREEEDSIERVFTVVDSNLRSNNFKIKKFAEGIGLRVAMGRDGSLLAWQTGESAEKLIQMKKPVSDFVITQVIETRKVLGKTSKTEAAFVKSCAVEKLLPDPWLQKGIGKTVQGQIVMAAPTDSPTPCIYTKFRELKSLTPYIDRE